MFYVYVDRFYSQQDIFEAAEIVTNGHGDLIPRDVALQVMVFDKIIQQSALNSNAPVGSIYISKTEDVRQWDIWIGPFKDENDANLWKTYLIQRGHREAKKYSIQKERKDYLVWY